MKFPRILTVMVLGIAALAGCQQKTAEAEKPAMTEEQKAIYAFGLSVGQQVGQQTKQLRLTPEEIATFQAGFGDALLDKTPQVEISQYAQQFQTFAQARLAAGAAEAQQKGEEVLVAAAKEPGAVKTDSGLVFRTITPGTGESPKATDTVRVNYKGTLPDGKVFDSSIERGQPAEFPLNRVIPCWTEGVQRMKVGEKAKLVCPPAIAYGERGAGQTIPPNATLTFEVDLLAINPPAEKPAAEKPAADQPAAKP
jgi:FKBP-type peptidyl-prolyl cis-trans isomerase FkpA